MHKKIDILVVSPHPDDAEIFMGGSLLKWAEEGLRTGICDLSRGEASTNGDLPTRAKEAQKATTILKLHMRKTLEIEDGHVLNRKENRMRILEVIREYQPDILFTTMEGSRHPDHHHSYQLVKDAAFLSGLKKINAKLEAHRPSALIGFPEFFMPSPPSFIVDITKEYETKKAAVLAYASQVLLPHEEVSQTTTLIKSQEMWNRFETRARMAGSMIGVRYGEPFYVESPLQMTNLLASCVKKATPK